jgi:hypothetical protein
MFSMKKMAITGDRNDPMATPSVCVCITALWNKNDDARTWQKSLKFPLSDYWPNRFVTTFSGTLVKRDDVRTN